MRRGESGSALIEAIVGAAIIATTLVAMYQAIRESASHNLMAEERRTAIMIAQSELAAVGPVIPAAPGVTEGADGDFYWRVDIVPYAGGPAPSIAGVLCSVRVTVTDRQRRPLATLNSLTLARET
ncbi:MAG TPA: hypothetical protein VG843_07105 [Rhizomicrobium sp.]|jgi:hypothetical protein|nr:hypothetical protein [Rhizomicrobium sp.]